MRSMFAAGRLRTSLAAGATSGVTLTTNKGSLRPQRGRRQRSPRLRRTRTPARSSRSSRVVCACLASICSRLIDATAPVIVARDWVPYPTSTRSLAAHGAGAGGVYGTHAENASTAISMNAAATILTGVLTMPSSWARTGLSFPDCQTVRGGETRAQRKPSARRVTSATATADPLLLVAPHERLVASGAGCWGDGLGLYS